MAMSTNMGGTFCKHCNSRLVVQVIRPEFEGDVINKTLPLRTCSKCDAPAPLPKVPWKKRLEGPEP